jgi:predicted anti-sigma-YlaC factor YlaD
MTLHGLFLRFIRDYPCVEFVEAVTDYFEGTMPASEQARFERHLARCAGCRDYLDQCRRTIELCGRVTVADVEALPDPVREELMDAFRAFHAGR